MRLRGRSDRFVTRKTPLAIRRERLLRRDCTIRGAKDQSSNADNRAVKMASLPTAASATAAAATGKATARKTAA